jgi:hypothetical protein
MKAFLSGCVYISCFVLFCLLLPFFVTAQRSSLLASTYSPTLKKGRITEHLRAFNSSQKNVLLEYSTSSFDTSGLIHLSENRYTLAEFFTEILRDQFVTLVQSPKKIMLVPSRSRFDEDALAIKYNVFGIVREASSGEPLRDALITVPGRNNRTHSDAQGYFTLAVPEGARSLVVSYVGLEEARLDLTVTSNLRVDVKLTGKEELKLVTVVDDERRRDGSVKIKTDKELYDNILGEADPLRSLYLLPGVQNIPDITNGIVVRGGGPDQNLFYQDGIPIFNPTHMLGMISIVNKTALKSLDFYKNNFPARYGGNTASVIDVYTKDGDMNRWKGQANAGLLSGSLTVEGPLQKQKTAIMVAGRYSWINPFLRLARSSVGLNFYDLNLKITHLIGKKDKITLNAYTGQDHMRLFYDSYNNRQRWGNEAASLNWSHIAGSRAIVSTTASLSNYHNLAGFLYNLFDSSGRQVQQRIYNSFSSIQQYNLSSQVKIALSNSFRVNAGSRLAYTRINPFETNISSDFANADDFNSFPRLKYSQAILFAEAEIKLDSQLFIRAGLHNAWFKYGDYQHSSIQPRIYATYNLDETKQLLFSYNRMTQFRHQVINPYLGINNDIWLPSTASLKPENSNMFDAGITVNRPNDLYWSAEVYYQYMNHVTNYAEGKNMFLNHSDWEESIESGKGWTYGLELNAGKTWKQFQVRMAYTLSWNWRKFENLNGGEKFPFKYDRRHYLNLAGTWVPHRQVSFSAAWTFATGDVFTLPGWIYPDFDNSQQITDPLNPKEYRLIYHSSSTNQYRNLSYHRLDFSGAWRHSASGKLPAILTAGVYNVYGSPAQYLYDLEGTMGKRSLVVTTKYNVFSVMPYVSYTINF